MNDTLRAFTAEEVREQFLGHIHDLVRYWDSQTATSYEKLDGLAFSILSMTDGTTIQFPSMDLVLRPHESDLEYYKTTGQNWFEDGMVINEVPLHEHYYPKM